MKMLKVLALATALVVASCAPTMTALAPGVPAATEASFTVTPPQAWSRIPAGLNFQTAGSVLTRHGMNLDRVDLITAKPGRGLLRNAPNADLPVFRAGMSDLETVELVTTTLARMNYTGVTAANVRPHPFGAANGVRFDLSGKDASGLNVKGDVALAQSGGSLHVIIYLAPAQRYFDLSATEVDAMIKSAALTGK
jgi:hypothetical protein